MLLSNNLANMVNIDELDAMILDITPNNIIRETTHHNDSITIPAKTTDDNYYVLKYTNRDLHFANLVPTQALEMMLVPDGEY